MEGNNTDLVVDRISPLPDSILGHILSFLRTDEAVATSILSKRWKSAWVIVHNLDFYYDVAEQSSNSEAAYNIEDKIVADRAENMDFIKFVERVLRLTDAGPLNKFSLFWNNCIISSHLCSWIKTAITRNVRELHLDLGLDGEIITIPVSGFNCDSLRSLSVSDLTLVHDATAVSLPRLESLKLGHVYFTSKEACEKLVSGCPMLHHLSLNIYVSCCDEADDDFMCIISSASLRSVDIDFEERSRLKLKASSLEYLRLHGCISEIFVEKSLSTLIEAEFLISLGNHNHLIEHDFVNNSIVEAVRAFEHVKFLTLSTHVMQALSRATISLSTEFTRLVKLHVETYCSSLQDFIQSSANLEALIIDEDSWYENDVPDHSRWTTPVEVPRCLSTSLKKVQLDGYKGLEDEREMIHYMLEHGRALEVMQIRCSYRKGDGEKLELLQEICEFPRKSPACKVQF